MRHGTYGTTFVQHRCIADGSRQNCVPMKGHCEHLVVVVAVLVVEVDVVVVVVLVALLVVVCVLLMLLYWHRLWELTVAIAFCLMQFAIDFFLSLLLLFEQLSQVYCILHCGISIYIVYHIFFIEHMCSILYTKYFLRLLRNSKWDYSFINKTIFE